MALINLNDLKPGMVLAAPVYNKNGGLLLNKGVPLSEKHLKIFKTWGVTEADIEGYDKEKLEEEAYSFLSDEEAQEIEARLQNRFFDYSSSEIMAEIFRIAKKQKMEVYMKKGTEV
ncbi:MAG: hypothetical protein JW928_09125 [Candidatus Aureabacteria bacterium]|nr:hypothetical protein [Candidatus Auribacterota bacterium]